MTSHQEAIIALAEASQVPEPVAAAALAIEESRQFRGAFQPVLDGTLHPAAIEFARIAREHDMTRSTTERGFAIYDEFTDTYGGVVRVQESSIATESRCWIFIGTAEPVDTPGAHLNVEQAKRVRDALDAFIAEANGT